MPYDAIERVLRFNCPEGCDGNGTFPEMSADGDWEQGQCQWCFEYGMPTRNAIKDLMTAESKKMLENVEVFVIGKDEFPTEKDEWHGEEDAQIIGRDELRDEQRKALNKIKSNL